MKHHGVLARTERAALPCRYAIGAIALAAALGLLVSNALVSGDLISRARAADEGKYPDWSGKWRRVEGGPPRYDPSKPRGRAQEAPLTPEYQALFEANLAEQDSGGQGNDPTYTCLPVGMPRQMTSGFPIELVITPRTTYVLYESSFSTTRRIFTDGRPWPKNEEPTFAGFSVGKWSDTTGTGRYDTLEVETRNIRGPRAFDNSGAPLHKDNETVVKERIFPDQTDPDILHNELTTFDHALTRPWTVMKNYRRDHKEVFPEDNCSENNNHVVIGKEGYFLSADGRLMPTRKDQPPPDLRYFKQAGK
jgi:hypothetical protein